MPDPWALWGESAKTAAGFFWKAGWAFVLGYAISGMIQAFVPKGRLTPYMGGAGPKSIALASGFGAASSSCSFAALATARAVFLKGAHFVAAVAFMFASTNLVIELGILIFIFLGWQFVVAEVAGGIVLIAISGALIRFTYPKTWIRQAREKVEEEAPEVEGDFDWRQRIRSVDGWRMAAHRFVREWGMVWEEIIIGFTAAGFIAVLVPKKVWTTIFLVDSGLPGAVVAVENALLGPFVAMSTFIGSMGNIPLAAVLASQGVLFAGVMAFIYSDLVVPPIVAINMEYYGKRVALYIAGIMFVSIVATALLMHASFESLGLTPESSRSARDIAQFKLDYTFWLNMAFLVLAGGLAYLSWQHVRRQGGPEARFEWTTMRVIAAVALAVVAGGLVAFAVTGGTNTG